MNCDNCGKEIAETDNICPYCGDRSGAQFPLPSGDAAFGHEGDKASATPVEGNSHAGEEPEPQAPPEFAEDKAGDTANRNEVVLLVQKAMHGDDSLLSAICCLWLRTLY